MRNNKFGLIDSVLKADKTNLSELFKSNKFDNCWEYHYKNPSLYATHAFRNFKLEKLLNIIDKLNVDKL